MSASTPVFKPNKRQNDAISHPPSPLMILAGAGTGKTFTLQNRIVHLINHYKVKPKHILAITYTEKAAKELRERIQNQIGTEALSLTVGTFHSFCYKILRDFTENQPAKLLEESEAIHLFLERFDSLGPFQSDEFSINPHKAITESFIPFFNRIKDELINPSKMEIPEMNEEIGLTLEISNQLMDLKRIYPMFQEWKQRINVLDYGDMVIQAHKVLSNNPNILKDVQDHFRHIIIDEFQDNNFALNKVASLIAGTRKFITVVGDDDQVIYSFRGASSRNISSFQKSYQSHEQYKIVSLEKNYRSSQAILDLANSSISNNDDRILKTLVSETKKTPIKPSLVWGEKNAQIDFLIHEIKHLSSDGVPFDDMAILCRTRSQVELIIEELQSYGLPVIKNKLGLLNCSLVRDILSWCQLICGGTYQDSALYRIIENKYDYSTAHSIFSKFDKKNKKPRYELISNNHNILTDYPKLKMVIKDVIYFQNIMRKKSAGEMVWEITTKLKLLINKVKKYTFDDHYDLLNVGDFLKRAQNFSHRNKKDNSLIAYNRYLESIMRSGGLPSIPPNPYRKYRCIHVNTIHGVKGAEFPVVFIPFNRSASFPLSFRSEKYINKPPMQWLPYKYNSNLSQKEHHLQEERRLFYVAVTRAKDMLYLLAPKKATSPFIKELSNELIHDISIPESNKESIMKYSELRKEYEQQLQKALSREEYKKVTELSITLKEIKAHESGEEIELSNQEAKQRLETELEKKNFKPKHEQIYLSASAIETYENCSLKYRLGRLDGVPQTANKPELIFGNIIHKVLQRFHKPNSDLSKDRILRILDEEWKNGEFDYKIREEKFKEQGIEILTEYIHYINGNTPNVLKREHPFDFNIGKINIRGVIDRIDKGEDGTAIIDYKTSRTTSSAKKSLQLAIYSMYLEQSTKKEINGLPSSASLYFLREYEKPIKSHTFTKDELIEIKEKIMAVAEGIQKREFSAKKGRHCDWCDYKFLACPEWED